MAFGGLDKKSNGAPMAEINMTPLIDVMLVLLVIFIITAPLFTHAIRLDLPKVASQVARETLQYAVLERCQVDLTVGAARLSFRQIHVDAVQMQHGGLLGATDIPA